MEDNKPTLKIALEWRVLRAERNKQLGYAKASRNQKLISSWTIKAGISQKRMDSFAAAHGGREALQVLIDAYKNQFIDRRFWDDLQIFHLSRNTEEGPMPGKTIRHDIAMWQDTAQYHLDRMESRI